MTESNIKDIATNIAGLVIAISGAILAIDQGGTALPPTVKSIAVVAAALATAVLAYYTGKNPNGSTKTPDQVVEINAKATAPEPKTETKP